MKRFLLTIICAVGIPVLIVFGIFLWTDPFKILQPFDIHNINSTNREYLSTELFFRNKDSIPYNAFVFSSSRGGGINTYTWKMFLPEEAQPFLFQAWSESLTGIELKLQYLDQQQIPIDYALILLDIPGSFAKEQLPTAALSMKHYFFTGTPKWVYVLRQFSNFIGKPSEWIKSIKHQISGYHEECVSDLVTNDWDSTNYLHFDVMPGLDSLQGMSAHTRQLLLDEVAYKTDADIKESKPVINSDFEAQLLRVKALLDKQQTDYHIIITPGYAYVNPYINIADLSLLESIFGTDRVHDYSRRKDITTDYHYFQDPGHFGQRAGWVMLHKIFCGR